jgi:predicted DNA-binding protein
MKDALSRYTLRVNPVLLEKLGYIAEFEGRTKNKEIEQLVKKRIKEFEKNNGVIKI